MNLRLLFIVFGCAVWYLIHAYVTYGLGKLRFFVLISHVYAIGSGWQFMLAHVILLKLNTFILFTQVIAK